jgi:soluble lytic murein transglycosylase
MTWSQILKNSVVLSLFVLLLTGFVKPITINIEELPRVDRWSASSAGELTKKLKTVKDPLVKAGIADGLADWETCAVSAKKVSPKSSIRDWALLLELNCARQWAEEDDKPKSGKTAGEILSDSIRRTEAFSFDTYSKTLQDKKLQALLAARLSLCKWLDKHSRWKDLKSELVQIFKLESFFSKSDRALLYYYAGDVMVADRLWSDAFWQFQRAHDLSPDVSQIESRVKGILPMVPPSIREQFTEKFVSSPELPSPTPNPSSEEMDLGNQADGYLTRNDTIAAVDALVKMIKKFPGGVRSKWAQDKMFELFASEIEKSRGPDGPSVAKKKIETVMLEFDSERQYEWGHSLFDMQAYAESAPILRKSADQVSGSKSASKAYYLAGRAYQLTNDYSNAKELFQLIVKNYPASPEVVDAAIQWALANINENDPSEAITHLEIARTRKMTSQQDLISLFWLYQSYKLKNTESGITDKGNELIRRFGITYYGLIAYSDLKKNLPAFDKTKTKTAKVFFSEAELHGLERARALLNAGLLNAAAEELSPFSARSLSTAEEQYLANFYAQALHYQKAFGLLASVIDESPERKTDFIVRQIFPKEYYDIVSDDKRRSDVDPFLLLSVMKQESAFDHMALSRSGAVGLMQMIPPTGEEVKKELNSDADIPSDLNDPATNVRFCAYYLNRLLKKYNGSVPLALAAYNAGPTRINQFMAARGGVLRDTWVDELPWSETSFYVKSILKNYVFYRILYGGLNQLPSPPWNK